MIKLTNVTRNEFQSSPVAPVKKTESATTKASSVALTPSTEQTITQARHELAQFPEVDLDKVAQVKAGLARGEIKVDTVSLASAITDFFQRSE